jgi:Ca2+-transporting ATPase
VVEDGQIIPADASILKLNDFSVNESILTGESLPAFKSLDDNENKIYKGTLVMTGSCVAKVERIGKQTKFDQIGQSLKEIEVVKTPLQFQIKNFIRLMVIAGSIAFVVVWGINFYMTHDFLHGLLHGLTLAMSVLPEEIPVAFSTFMALGAYHLYKKRVIVRVPHTVETLGAATVICVDKTGTITENEMRLASIYDFSNNETYDYANEPIALNPVLEYALWASETHPFDTMEKSIHAAYGSVATMDQRPHYTLVHEYPLSGNPPIMTHVFRNEQGNTIIACKGGVEGVMNQCELTRDEENRIQQTVKNCTSKGYRVLGVGFSAHDVSRLPISQHDLRFTFSGLISF